MDRGPASGAEKRVVRAGMICPPISRPVFCDARSGVSPVHSLFGGLADGGLPGGALRMEHKLYRQILDRQKVNAETCGG